MKECIENFVDIQHIYELIFTEHKVNVYGIDEFLNDFEKLCLKHHVKFDHLSVKLVP